MATKWYLRGWEPLPYQWAFHHLEKANTSWIAGIATGKTTGVASSYLLDCLAIPYFRALNTSVTAKQAELPFSMVMGWIEGNPKLEHLVENISLRPFPTITFKNFSEYEFRTAGTDARFIRGFEYDRINYDEAGLDLMGETIKVLRGRCRGTRIDGTERLARLDVTTSPTGALWLIERFNKGWRGKYGAELDLYTSMRTATWENTKLPLSQIEAMKAEYPPEMIDVELGGQFPDFGVAIFPIGHLNACMSQPAYDTLYMATNPEDGKPAAGWELHEDPRHGITKFAMPYKPNRVYIMGGDPGTGNYPARNAACVMVADVTEQPYRMVYFDWISGNGSINPFLRSFKKALETYRPVLRGIDATGTQKMMDEIAFENYNIETDKINFSTDKPSMLNALSYDIVNHKWSVPPVQGLIKQASTYTYEEDKKIPQDLIMTWAELSFLARFVPAQVDPNANTARNNYRNRNARTNYGRRRR